MTPDVGVPIAYRAAAGAMLEGFHDEPGGHNVDEGTMTHKLMDLSPTADIALVGSLVGGPGP